MIKIVEMSHLLAEIHINHLLTLKPFLTVVDATCGLGNDTIFLANLLKDKGHVYSYDIQKPAIEETTQKILNLGINNITLKNQSHVLIDEEAPDLVIFNLGYLPNHDKTITTKATTTIEALHNLLLKMDINSHMLILLVIYPGHEEGLIESEMIDNLVRNLPSNTYLVSKYLNYNRSSSPYLISINKDIVKKDLH